MTEAELVAIEARVRLVLTCHECKTLLLAMGLRHRPGGAER